MIDKKINMIISVLNIYKTVLGIIELIKKSSNKWIIFSDSEGSRINKQLKDEEKCIFLSRKGIENEENKKSL